MINTLIASLQKPVREENDSAVKAIEEFSEVFDQRGNLVEAGDGENFDITYVEGSNFIQTSVEIDSYLDDLIVNERDVRDEAYNIFENNSIDANTVRAAPANKFNLDVSVDYNEDKVIGLLESVRDEAYDTVDQALEVYGVDTEVP